jgi:hypothetical protein
MSAQWIKPNSFRTALLQAFADGAIATIDDLQTRLDEPRKKIQDNVMHAVIEQLLKRLRDDVTGAPAYQITAKGRAHLATAAGQQPKNAAPARVPPRMVESIADFSERCKEQPSEEIEQDVLENKPILAVVEVATPQPEVDAPRLPAPETEPYVLWLGASLERHLSLESAQARALSIARNGERTVVYRMVPVGTALPVPGAEWHDQ